MAGKSKPLPLSYYRQEDVISLSQNLLGKFLFTCVDGFVTGGMITETEAYRGPEDRASHAYGNRRTQRNEVMYGKGGVAYVYLCYGIHSLFNIVTGKENVPHAILVRAIQPTCGIEIMLKRRKKASVDKTLTLGPGSLSQAMGITRDLNGTMLTGNQVWVEDQGILVNSQDIVCGPRVGIDYAGEDALLPWRFQLKLNSFTSE